MSLTRTKVMRVVSAPADPASSTATTRTARRRMADIVGSTADSGGGAKHCVLSMLATRADQTPLNCVHYLIQSKLRGEPSYEKRAGRACLARLMAEIKGALRRIPFDRALLCEGPSR